MPLKIFLIHLFFTGTFLHFSSFTIAQGEYIWDKSHGCKCFTYLNSSSNRTFTYTGKCENGYVSGKAMVTFYVDGEKWSVYTGDFDRGFLNGPGSVEFVDAYRYDGSFVNYNKQGKGRITDLRSGDIMEASFDNDKLTGDVKIRFLNGDSYAGGVRPLQWTMKEGKGIYYFKNGNRFEGIFSLDACKEGTMYYKNGTSEKGELVGEGQSYTFKKVETSKNQSTYPTLDQLQSWLKSGYAKFDTEIRRFGFKFEDKDINDGTTSYYYTRPVNNGNNDVISFVFDKDQTGIEMILQQDFFASYQASIKANKYVSSSCNALELIGVDSKECKEYDNDSFQLMLHQWRELSNKKEADQDPYSFSAKIATKKK